jgi:hypothetical protein
MANPEHLAKLEEGVEAWNAWRKGNTNIRPDLGDANLSFKNLTQANFFGANLSEANLSEADLCEVNLQGASLDKVDLSFANLIKANLSCSDLSGADLRGAKLIKANLYEAKLLATNLNGASLNCADLENAYLLQTVFADTNLTEVKGLEQCQHLGPNSVDHRTIIKSGKLPDVFLRGCGLPERLIEYYPSLLNEEPIQFYSCFISYSTEDEKFAERLHADLQAKGVRCWFAPHDLKTGDEIRERIDQEIRVRDKLLVIFSENSINSEWVKDEVNTAFEEEGKRQQQGRKDKVLFPIRLDDSVLDVNAGWARKSRDRLIADFTQWKDHDSYTKAFDRLLKDLKASGEG